MSIDVLVAEMLALGYLDAAPTAVASDPTPEAPGGRDRSPESLAVVLVRVAERVRTDPEANFAHCAVRGAADVLRARLDERRTVSPGAARDATEGP